MKAQNTLLITEGELRTALLAHLKVSQDSNEIIVEEMGIENGAARIDMAVISDTLSGFEIKSDYDNAIRLSNQIHAYNRVFQHICIVLGSSTSLGIEGIVPSWWGIIRAHRTENGEIFLFESRAPIPNKLRDTHSLLTLMKREELDQLAMRHGIPKKMIKGTKQFLIDTLANILPFDTVNLEATAALRSRAVSSIV